LDDLLAARAPRPRRTLRTADDAADPAAGITVGDDIQLRLKARESPSPRFCWHCRKPLHARSERCPFCGEQQ
jgi:hypothetical protein